MYAKLSPPDATRLVARRRLHGLLDAQLGGTAWLTAPAGAGKTSLLASWVQGLRRPAHWYRIDSGDADPASFFDWFARLVGAAGQVSIPSLAPEHLLNLPHFARRFFRACFSAMAADTVVVLDNVHDAADADVMTCLLLAMVQERPPRITLVFSSRTEPTNPVLASQADPAHRHLRWRDLRCTDDEALALAQAWGKPAPSAELLARAAGWMAALAVLLRQAEAGSPAAWQASPDAAVFDLFAQGAFQTLGAKQQLLLQANAFVPWIDPGSTDRLCGTDNAAALLDGLWRSQFFVERRHGPGQTLQYLCHPLLRAFLQARASSLWPEAERQRIGLHHARAFEALGDVDAALEMYLQADAREQAARVVLQQAPALMAAGKLATLMAWLQRLPDATLQAAPSLQYWQGLCLTMTAPPQAIACLQRAHAGHVARGEVLPALLDVCAMMDAYFAQWDQWTEARPWADELARLYAMVEGRFPSVDLEVRVLSAGVSLIFPCFDHPLVARWLSRAEALLRTSSVPEHHLQLSCFLIAHAWWAGEPLKIREVSRIATYALARTSASPLVAFQLHMWIGIGAYSDGHAADPALAGHVDQVLALGEAQGVHLFDFHAWCHKVMEAMATDDATAGAHALARAQALNPGARGARQLLTLCEIAQRLLAREWQAAADLGLESRTVSPDFGGWVFGRQTLCLGLAQALVMLGRHDEACALMDGPLDFARRLPSPYFDLMAHCVLASGAYAQGDTQRGDACLRRALGIARAQGFRHLPPWWSPPFFAPLMARALEAGIESGWVTQLIRQQQMPAPATHATAWPYPVRVHALGPWRIALDGKPLIQQGKAQRRVLELLKALAAQGGRAIAAQTLAADLWPDGEGDAAMSAFDVTLHRARKLLGHPRALLLHDGLLSLNPELVWLDLWALQRLGEGIERCTDASGQIKAAPEQLQGWVQAFTQLLGGPLLAGEQGNPWLTPVREAHRRRTERLGLRLGAACAAAGGAGLERDMYGRMLDADPSLQAIARAQASLP